MTASCMAAAAHRRAIEGERQYLTLPSASSAAPPAPAPPSATALLVGPGPALTALKPGDCQDTSVDGKPARFERTDVGASLALLSGDFGAKAEVAAPRRAFARSCRFEL